MKTLILIAAIVITPFAAVADTRTTTIMGPNGTMTICTETTIGSMTTVNCF